MKLKCNRFRIEFFAVLMCFTIAVEAKSSFAQIETTDQPLYIIFDGSNSMWGELPDKTRKIAIAREIFNQWNSSSFNDREIALRLYGHRRTGDCSDTELVMSFTRGAKALEKALEKIKTISPRGKSPISQSLKAALEDFNGRSGDILLISDGTETCDIDPCELVRNWQKKEIDIRVHTVGLGLSDDSRNAMKCMAEVSGATYHDADSVSDFLINPANIAASNNGSTPDSSPERLVYFASQPGLPTLDSDSSGGNPFATAFIEAMEVDHSSLYDFEDKLASGTDYYSEGFQQIDFNSNHFQREWIVSNKDAKLDRVALVLVISDYSNSAVPSLPGAMFDANRIANTLTEAGYKTTKVVDPNRLTLATELAKFREGSFDAEASIIYVTGHGVEIDKTVYLLYGDYPVEGGASALEIHASPLENILKSGSAKSMNLVFYAGCRDNPFEGY